MAIASVPNTLHICKRAALALTLFCIIFFSRPKADRIKSQAGSDESGAKKSRKKPRLAQLCDNLIFPLLELFCVQEPHVKILLIE